MVGVGCGIADFGGVIVNKCVRSNRPLVEREWDRSLEL